MARKVNKAQAIRDSFEEMGRDARPKDIVEALAARKIKVSPTQVSNIKTKLKGMASAAVGPNGKPSDLVSLRSLKAAKALVDTTGSVQAAKSAIDAIASLV